METVKHWTYGDSDAFVYAIASDFVAQIETKLEQEGMSRKAYGKLLDVTPGRVSQLLNDPSSFNLRSVVNCARALGMKVSIVAYEDGDSTNISGPINSQVFASCWENFGRPRDLLEFAGTPTQPAPIQSALASQSFYRPEPWAGPAVKAENSSYGSVDLVVAAAEQKNWTMHSKIGQKHEN